MKGDMKVSPGYRCTGYGLELHFLTGDVQRIRLPASNIDEALTKGYAIAQQFPSVKAIIMPIGVRE
jgi:hypothetical protein